MRGSKGGQGVRSLPWKITPPSARQRNAILKAFHWRADDSPLRILVRTPVLSLKYDD